MQTARRGHPRTFWAVVRALAAEGPSSFYHGLVPGLLLTCNPAINYAAFDAMRVLVAGLRRTLVFWSEQPYFQEGGEAKTVQA
jgi:hypothetical protein